MIGGEGEGRLKVKVHEVFPGDQVVEAQKEMEAKKKSGQVRENPFDLCFALAFEVEIDVDW